MMERIFVIILAVIGLDIVATTVSDVVANLTGISATVAGYITVFFALAILGIALRIGKGK